MIARKAATVQHSKGRSSKVKVALCLRRHIISFIRVSIIVPRTDLCNVKINQIALLLMMQSKTEETLLQRNTVRPVVFTFSLLPQAHNHPFTTDSAPSSPKSATPHPTSSLATTSTVVPPTSQPPSIHTHHSDDHQHRTTTICLFYLP